MTPAKLFLLFLVPFLVILMEKPSLGAADGKKDEPRAGGPCEYHRYEGRTEITSVRKIADPQKQAGEKYEVRFKFTPNQEIKEPFVQVEGREFLLEINYTSSLSQEFIEQHGIRTGAVFNGYLQAIVRGTCTPVIFEFPSLSSK
jgi:hypothetical protein